MDSRVDKPHRGRRGAVALLCLGLSGCAPGRAAASAPAGAETTAPVADIACDAYVATVCAKVGEAHSLCASTRETAKLLAPSACQAAITNFAFSADAINRHGAPCRTLAARLCKDLGQQTPGCAMVGDQTPKFSAARCDEMLLRYDEVLADLQAREEYQKPLDAAAQVAIKSGTPLVSGPEDAKVTLVVFSDFECPFCARAAASLAEVKRRYPDTVRIVYRQFPLKFHTHARIAAEAAFAAGEQGKFAEYHDLLFAHQRALERPELGGYAKEIGLELTRFNEALDTGKHASAVDADIALGQLVHVSGTPTVFVNGQRVTSAVDVDEVLRVVDAAL